jgi:hypothetical protein
MIKLHHFIIACLISGICLAAYAAPASAGDESRHQTLGSDPDVYRVEIRGLKYFFVFKRVRDSGGYSSTGNRFWEGELEWIKIYLEADGQKHSRKEFANDLRVDSRWGSGGKLRVRRGEAVKFGDTEFGAKAGTVLWVHANKSRPGNATEVWFEITTKGAGCIIPGGSCENRGRNTNRLVFELPVFETPPPMDCGRENTFQIRTTNNLYPYSMMIEDRERVPNSSSPSRDVPPEAIMLFPFQATICIASTRLP